MKRSGLGALGAALALCQPSLGADELGPGAYCPLPPAGEVPECLEPARGAYSGFLEGLEQGAPGGSGVQHLEADLARGAASERSYLALSTLAFGYYQLARRIAAPPGGDPVLVARLEHWNGLLARAYAVSDDDAYRQAVRSAARDVRERSPAVQLGCIDAKGEPAACTTTEAVLRGFDRASGDVGVRGSLRRILERLGGKDEP